MKNVWVRYRRVSSTEQLKGDGISRQGIAIDRFLSSQQGDVVADYIDDYTGTSEHRPELDKMFVELKYYTGPNIQVNVVVERSDRLARDVMKQEMIIVKMQRKNVKVWSAATHIDLTLETPDNKMLRRMMGIMAEFDKDNMVAKCKAGRDAKRKMLLAAGGTGKVEGRKGYAELCPRLLEEVLWLKYYGTIEMFGLHSDKIFGNGRIAKVLNDMGYKSMSGGKITAQIVRSILKTADGKNMRSAK